MWDNPRVLNLAAGTLVGIAVFIFAAAAVALVLHSPLFPVTRIELTQAVSARDPSNGNQLGMWTQHAVAGAAGARVRWYEINPAVPTVLRAGRASHLSLFAFNAAISPDRAVRGDTSLFGDSMAMTYNTSSASTPPAIVAVSKVGDSPQSDPVTIVTSPNPDVGFDCVELEGKCRWGDYAGATPDPLPAVGSRVWFSNMYNEGTSTTQSTWTTRNFAVTP